MSGGLTPCRQLRPSSRREHVRASNSQIGWGGEEKKNEKRRSLFSGDSSHVLCHMAVMCL